MYSWTERDVTAKLERSEKRSEVEQRCARGETSAVTVRIVAHSVKDESAKSRGEGGPKSTREENRAHILLNTRHSSTSGEQRVVLYT